MSTPETTGKWGDHAEDLARWTLGRLVNRRDVWGGYTPPDRRGQQYRRRDGSVAKVPASYTAPGPERRGQLLLNPALLIRHFQGRRHEHVLGLHAISEANTSLWGGIDLDWHGPDSTALAINLRAALAWHDRLVELGYHPLLTSSNGKGGYHLRVLLAEAIDSARLFHFMQRLVSDHARHGMTAPPETFPRQPRLTDRTRYGNWLRLPGRHHTRDHWSQVWDGQRWLEAAAACSHILSLQGDPGDRIPQAPPPPRSRRPFVVRAGSECSLARRIAGYVRRCCPHLAEGQGRHRIAFRLAAFLVRDLAVSADVAQAWLERWDAVNTPPLGCAALLAVMEDARRYGQNVEGCARLQAPTRHSSHRPVTLRGSVEMQG